MSQDVAWLLSVAQSLPVRVRIQLMDTHEA